MTEKTVCNRCGVTLVWAGRTWKHNPGRAGMRGCGRPVPVTESDFHAAIARGLQHAGGFTASDDVSSSDASAPLFGAPGVSRG